MVARKKGKVTRRENAPPVPDIKTDKDVKEMARDVLEQLVELERTENQRGERTPGSIVAGRKTPTTMIDVKKMFPEVTFVPDESLPVSFNGVKVHLRSGEEITVPSIFKGIYDDHRRAMRQAANNPNRLDMIGPLNPAD